MIYLDQADGQFLVSLSKKFDDVTYVWPAWQSEEARRVHQPALRRTRGIVTDSPSSEPRKEADVIMTAAALGFAGDYIATTKRPLQFDMDPFDADDPKEKTRTALPLHGGQDGCGGGGVPDQKGPCAERSPFRAESGYWPGATIMGVYALAGQEFHSRRSLVPPGRRWWRRFCRRKARSCRTGPDRRTHDSSIHGPRRIHGFCG